jgi:LmbE family N-acetylglucosaminyl deacetylase
MIRFSFCTDLKKKYRVLCLGAHSDDIEIGCGGTILRLAAKVEKLEVWWLVFSGTEERLAEAEKSAHEFLNEVKSKRVILKSFRDGFFPFEGERIKMYFEELKRVFAPELIFTHYRYDLHQDHRTISELTWNTFRDHAILEYEVPKYDGDLGCPNFFAPLDKEICTRKVEVILKNFVSQRQNAWFDKETFFGLLRLRGIEANSPTKYAEGFYSRKMLLA